MKLIHFNSLLYVTLFILYLFCVVSCIVVSRNDSQGLGHFLFKRLEEFYPQRNFPVKLRYEPVSNGTEAFGSTVNEDELWKGWADPETAVFVPVRRRRASSSKKGWWGTWNKKVDSNASAVVVPTEAKKPVSNGDKWWNGWAQKLNRVMGTKSPIDIEEHVFKEIIPEYRRQRLVDLPSRNITPATNSDSIRLTEPNMSSAKRTTDGTSIKTLSRGTSTVSPKRSVTSGTLATSGTAFNMVTSVSTGRDNTRSDVFVVASTTEKQHSNTSQSNNSSSAVVPTSPVSSTTPLTLSTVETTDNSTPVSTPMENNIVPATGRSPRATSDTTTRPTTLTGNQTDSLTGFTVSSMEDNTETFLIDTTDISTTNVTDTSTLTESASSVTTTSTDKSKATPTTVVASKVTSSTMLDSTDSTTTELTDSVTSTLPSTDGSTMGLLGNSTELTGSSTTWTDGSTTDSTEAWTDESTTELTNSSTTTLTDESIEDSTDGSATDSTEAWTVSTTELTSNSTITSTDESTEDSTDTWTDSSTTELTDSSTPCTPAVNEHLAGGSNIQPRSHSTAGTTGSGKSNTSVPIDLYFPFGSYQSEWSNELNHSSQWPSRGNNTYVLTYPTQQNTRSNNFRYPLFNHEREKPFPVQSASGQKQVTQELNVSSAHLSPYDVEVPVVNQIKEQEDLHRTHSVGYIMDEAKYPKASLKVITDDDSEEEGRVYLLLEPPVFGSAFNHEYICPENYPPSEDNHGFSECGTDSDCFNQYGPKSVCCWVNSQRKCFVGNLKLHLPNL